MRKERSLIAEGKTKRIWAIPCSSEVIIENKDDITAQDGLRHDVIPGKGKLVTDTTCNIFEYLKEVAQNIPTHYIERLGDTTFLAHRAKMLPVEVVIRGIVAGSYRQRYPDLAVGSPINPGVVELFAKNDTLHDPLIKFDPQTRKIHYYDAHKPEETGLIESKRLRSDNPIFKRLPDLQYYAYRTYHLLQQAWKQHNVSLVDMKIEYGINSNLMIADVIDADAMRLWRHKDPTLSLDKQVYRDTKKVTPDIIEKVLANYTEVARLTSQF